MFVCSFKIRSYICGVYPLLDQKKILISLRRRR
nr:MAG TPA: hypothetical protein [Caudoviricetes sp.]DAW72055.1 MAG TPA: hypothetical protein [Caudoviricetes sp.]